MLRCNHTTSVAEAKSYKTLEKKGLFNSMDDQTIKQSLLEKTWFSRTLDDTPGITPSLFIRIENGIAVPYDFQGFQLPPSITAKLISKLQRYTYMLDDKDVLPYNLDMFNGKVKIEVAKKS